MTEMNLEELAGKVYSERREKIKKNAQLEKYIERILKIFSVSTSVETDQKEMVWQMAILTGKEFVCAVRHSYYPELVYAGDIKQPEVKAAMESLNELDGNNDTLKFLEEELNKLPHIKANYGRGKSYLDGMLTVQLER